MGLNGKEKILCITYPLLLQLPSWRLCIEWSIVSREAIGIREAGATVLLMMLARPQGLLLTCLPGEDAARRRDSVD